MITREQYDLAIKQKREAEEVVIAYGKQRIQIADARHTEFLNGRAYSDDELFYSRVTLCPCGHGLAYVKEPGSQRYWDCSAILKGVADAAIQHTGQLPFAFYDVKGEHEINGTMITTRGVFKPKPKE